MYKFCLTHRYNPFLEKINYINVGLGPNPFPQSWLRDNSGDNIGFKNQYYDMYSFHYWLWKNLLHKLDSNKWISFSTYRRFWKNKNLFLKDADFKDKILQEAPYEWNGYDTILTEEIDLSNIKLMKILKKGKKLLLKNPLALIQKKKRNIKFHFDLMHLEGNLKKALELVDQKEKNQFTDFLNTNSKISLWNLFCCNSKELLEEWYSSVFPWLFRCEKMFGFKNLKGYETGRIYAYLAERYLPYWFKKYSKTRTWPIYFYDTNSLIDEKK